MDLREPTKMSDSGNLNAHEKILSEQHPNKNQSPKKSLFGRIFGKKTKESSEQLDKSDVNQDDENSKEQFIKEFKEISDNNDDNSINDEKIVIVDESVRFVSEEVSNSETVEEKKDTQNEVNDDLLQIPAFLRRQAN